MSSPTPAPTTPPLVASERVAELASGVDALYLSGRTALPAGRFEYLSGLREQAREADGPVALDALGEGWAVVPRPFVPKFEIEPGHPTYDDPEWGADAALVSLSNDC